MLINYFQGQPVRVQVDVAKSLEEAAQWACRQHCSLLTIVVNNQTQVAAARTLHQCRVRSHTTLRIALSPDPSCELVALLLEAGAAICIPDIASMQRLLPRIVNRCQLKSAGYHPLTSGLIERLPWREIDSLQSSNGPARPHVG